MHSIVGGACLAIAPAISNSRCCGTICRVLDKLASDDVLDTAYEWLCKRRLNYPPDADIWSFRHRWREEKVLVMTALLEGEYRFGLQTRVTLNDGEDIDLWSARDALVLKALALVLGEHLPISPQCTHVKGHGGAKAAVRQAPKDGRFEASEGYPACQWDVRLAKTGRGLQQRLTGAEASQRQFAQAGVSKTVAQG